MNSKRVVEELRKRYPNKTIVLNPPENTTEILCEIEPTAKHPDHSVAIAVIDSSKLHHHKLTTETYEVIKGNLKLYVEGQLYELSPGQSFTIKPGLKHYALGTETWIKVTSKPGWVLADHILL
jgi:quercetin dioxygenase-like cupin family protein